MRFLVRHNRHHKVSRSSYVTKMLLFCEEFGLGGHFVMPTQFPRNLIMRVSWTTCGFSKVKEEVSSKKRNFNKSVSECSCDWFLQVISTSSPGEDKQEEFEVCSSV